MPGKNRRLWLSLAMISAGVLTYVVGNLVTMLFAVGMMPDFGSSAEAIESLPQMVGEMSSIMGISAVITLIATGLVIAGLGLLTVDFLARALAGTPVEASIEG